MEAEVTQYAVGHREAESYSAQVLKVCDFSCWTYM